MASLSSTPTLAPAELSASSKQRRNLTVTLITAVIILTSLVPLAGDWFFGVEEFSPQGAMFNWQPTLLLLHFITDILIGFSYVAIAITLLVLTRRVGKYMPFLWAFIAFSVFIISGGLTHFVAAMTLWRPAYWLAGGVKYFTAIASVATAIALPPLIPKILNLVQSTRIAEDRKKRLETSNTELRRVNETLQREVEERARAEERERIYLRRLQAIIDSLPLGAMAIDEEERILHVNQQACDIFGIDVTPTFLIRKSGAQFFDRIAAAIFDGTSFHEARERTLSSRVPSFGLEVVLQDGRTISRDILPLDDEGVARGFLFLYRDITRERRVDAAKSEFMSLASHQLRTPLTAIRWSMGRLERSLTSRLTDGERELLGAGRDATRRMAHTIDTMLAISRIEAGKINPDPTEVKLGVLLNDVRVDCRDLYEAKGQTFTLQCLPNLFVYTDVDILKEILGNLYTNAIKYTPASGSIAVRGQLLDDVVRIEVADTGVGIPATQHDKVFRKFFRGDNILTFDTEGTGLGLYLVYLLVKILQGRILFTSREGLGTTFTVDLPASHR